MYKLVIKQKVSSPYFYTTQFYLWYTAFQFLRTRNAYSPWLLFFHCLIEETKMLYEKKLQGTFQTLSQAFRLVLARTSMTKLSQ